MAYDYRYFEFLFYKMVQKVCGDLHVLGCSNKLLTSRHKTSLLAATELAFRTMAEVFLNCNSTASGQWWLSQLTVEAPRRQNDCYRYSTNVNSVSSSIFPGTPLCIPLEIYRVFQTEWANIVTRALNTYKFYEDNKTTSRSFTVTDFPLAVLQDIKALLRETRPTIDQNILKFFSSFTQNIDIQVIDAISCEKYEGGIAKCQLAIISGSEEIIPFESSSQLPFTLENVRALRKQAEMGCNDMCLAISGKGRAACTRGLILKSKAFCPTISMSQPMRWQFSLPNDVNKQYFQSVQLCRNGSSFSFPPLTDEVEAHFFNQLCKKTFKTQAPFGFTELEHIVSHLRQNADKFHGVSILILENAEKETYRLCNEKNRGYKLNINSDTNKLGPSLIHLASIDGAIILSPAGKCTGFATILDGVAKSQGNSARGARYNSARTYLDNTKGSAIAVVISTDGSVDYLQRARNSH